MAKKEQYVVFKKYKRRWLSEITGYCTQYLCRIATGRVPLNNHIIFRFCSKLNESEAELFRKE